MYTHPNANLTKTTLKNHPKSPNLSVLVVGRVLTTCPGPTVMGSQKYFKSRKCQGWVSSRGYAVYLDLEAGAKVKKCGKVKWSKGRFLQCLTRQQGVWNRRP